MCADVIMDLITSGLDLITFILYFVLVIAGGLINLSYTLWRFGSIWRRSVLAMSMNNGSLESAEPD